MTENFFKNRIALITGATGGIGASVSRALAAQGTQLFLIGRKQARLEGLYRKCLQHTSRIFTCEADLEVDTDLHRVSKEFQSSFQRLDILIHCAGTFSMDLLEKASIEDLDHQYKVNLRAPYVLTRDLLPRLKESKGEIVFINSTAGFQARSGVSQYAATKFALRAFADSLREEVNEFGVRVLTVFLGRTATPMQKAIHDKEKKSYHPESLIQPDDVASVILNALSLPYTSEVTEIRMRPRQKPAS